MDKIITKSELATFKLGEKLGRQCVGGEIFMLSGNLGAGKTKLLQGLAAGLGVKSKVNSPTFNIFKIYNVASRPGRSREGRDKNNQIKIFCHLDAYRLGSAKDLKSLGVEEYFSRLDTVVAIEWAEKVKKIWPPRAKAITIKIGPKEMREIRIGKK